MSKAATIKAQQRESGRTSNPGHEAPTSRPALLDIDASIRSLQQTAGNRTVHDAIHGGGQALEGELRLQMESRFDQDFSQVRVHTGERAEKSAKQEIAKAYTTGNDIVFGKDRYSPHTSEGFRLLAHELTHVVQQRRGGPPPGSSHETEARTAARQASQGNVHIPVSQACGTGIARERDELALEDAQERLQAITKQRAVQVLHPNEQKRLDEERKQLERALFGESREEQDERFARDMGLAPGLRMPVPRPKPLPTRAELANQREKRAADRADLASKRPIVEQVEHTKVLQSQPTDVQGIWKKELAKAGIEYQRPLTDFEVRIRANPTAAINYPNAPDTAAKSVSSKSFEPLYDPETNSVIGYFTSFGGADYTLVDVNGVVVQQGDRPNAPPIVDPVEIGVDVAMGGPGAARALRTGVSFAGELLLGQITKRAPRMLWRLRSAAAATMIGVAESGVAPRITGGLMLDVTTGRLVGNLGEAVLEPVGKETAEQFGEIELKNLAGAGSSEIAKVGGEGLVKAETGNVGKTAASFSPVPADVGNAAFKARMTREVENVMRANKRNTIGSAGETGAQISSHTTAMDLNAIKPNFPQLDTISRQTTASVKAFGVDKPLTEAVIKRYDAELQALRTAIEPGVPTKLGKAADVMASHREVIQAAGAWPSGLARNAPPEQIAKFVNRQGVLAIPADHVDDVRHAIAANARANPSAYGLTPGPGLEIGIERLRGRVQSLGLRSDEIMAINQKVWGKP
jgi:hypothetical protein